MYQFGISTHLFHEHRLSRDHLVHIAAHGFEVVELFATRAHFDYKSPQAIAELAEWLSDTRLTLHSIHAPIVERMQQGSLGRSVLECLVRREPPEAGRRRGAGRDRGRRTDPVPLPRRCTSACPTSEQQHASDNQPMLRAAASRRSRRRRRA